MSTWSNLGLPHPDAAGYGCTIDAGLLRTPFASAHPRQKRQHVGDKRTFTVSVLLTQPQVQTAVAFLEAEGFTWFSIDLLSGQRDAEPVAAHCVRVVQDFSISAVGNGHYRLEMTLEQLVERSVIVTTTLYNAEAWDGLMTSQRLPPSMSMSTVRQPFDANSTAFRLPPSGNFQAGRYAQLDDSLGTAFRLPPVGSLGATYIPHYVDQRETQHLSTAFRLPGAGNLDPGILAELTQDDTTNTTFRLPSQGDLSP